MRCAGFGAGAHAAQLLPQRLGGGGQQLPGGGVLALLGEPRLQRLGARAHGGVGGARVAFVPLERRLRAQCERAAVVADSAFSPLGAFAAGGARAGTLGLAGACGGRRIRVFEQAPGARAIAPGQARFGLQQQEHALRRGLAFARGERLRHTLRLAREVFGRQAVAQLRLRERAHVERSDAIGGQRRGRATRCHALPGLWVLVRQHTCACLHQRMQQRRARRRFGAGQQHAVACLADAIHGERMSAQIGESAAVGDGGAALQPFEHLRHAASGKAGAFEHGEADTVGLALHLAREIELALNGRALPAHDGGIGRIDIVGAAGRQDAEQDGRHAQQRGIARVADATRNVALRHMRELVRQHRSELVAVGGECDEAEVHADIAARPGEGIHRAVAHEEELEGELALEAGVDISALARCVHQRPPQRLHIGQQDGVVEPGGVAPRFADDLVADAALLADAELVGGGVAERGQAWRGAGLLGMRRGGGQACAEHGERRAEREADEAAREGGGLQRVGLGVQTRALTGGLSGPMGGGERTWLLVIAAAAPALGAAAARGVPGPGQGRTMMTPPCC